MLQPITVNQSTRRRVPSVVWSVSATRFFTQWQVTATLLLNDLDTELEYNSSVGPAPRQSAEPIFPSFFSLLEAETAAEDVPVSFLE